MKRASRRLSDETRTSLALPHFDVIVSADMTLAGERAFRVAQEVRVYASEGKRVGLIHAASLPATGRIAAEIQTCVRRQLATVVAPTGGVTADLLLVHAPSEIDWSNGALKGLRAKQAKQAIVICHSQADLDAKLKRRFTALGDCVVRAVNPWLRDLAGPRFPISDDIWRPMLSAPPVAPPKPPPIAGRPRIAWLASSTTPAPAPSEGSDVALLDEHRLGQLSLDRLGMFDGLAYFPQEGAVELLDTVVQAALGMGVRVALPVWLKQHVGAGPIYCAPDDALKTLERGISTSTRRGKGSPHAQSERGRPVMFVPSNGMGVGHVSRLLAIARRMEPRMAVLFATQAQAVPVIERLGYRAEYTPSPGYVGGDFESWDEWYQHDLDALIDAYDPALVVYDGNNPSNGLVGAVAARRDCKLAWIRRGLWGSLTSPLIGNACWFNLIIEPGELDGLPDDGVTAKRRDEVLAVPPIRFLDEDELLSRDEAAKHIGLDPARPAVLIQLGAGLNRDVVGLIDRIIGVLRSRPQLQICVAEWMNGSQAIAYWPGVAYLRGYPLSQYFNAFDFSIAAAGYNTFHEIVSFDLPSIFIPNRSPTMDDQAGRAIHAQDRHASFELEEADLGDLPDLVDLLLDAKARDFLKSNSRALHRPNGAKDAALALTRLLGAAE